MNDKKLEWNDKQYQWFIKFIVATIPIIVLLVFFWFNGTSSKQYWNNFEEIEGEVVGPYVLIKTSNEILLNDSIKSYLDEYDRLKETILNLGFKTQYDSIYYPFWKLKFQNKQVDSLGPLTKIGWNKLKQSYEQITASVDTLLVSDSAQFRLKIKSTSKIRVQHYFSIKGYPYKFSISEYSPIGKSSDLMYFVDEYGGIGSNSFSNWEESEDYSNKLKEIIGSNLKLNIVKLKSDKDIARAYIIEAGWNNELYNDEYGFEALVRTKNDKIQYGSYSRNMDFVLWYDNWIVKLLLLFEVFFILRVALKIRKARN